MRPGLRRFKDDASGATAVEYAFIAALISVVIVAAAAGIAPELVTIFSNAEAGLKKGNS